MSSDDDLRVLAVELREMIDRQEIYDVLCRYCRGVDRVDLELVRDCYFEDAIDHHIGFEGPRDEFIAWVAQLLASLDGTMHTIANHLIEFGDRAACVETYVHTWMWREAETGVTEMSVTGTRYIDRFEQREGIWRIAERWAVRSFIESTGGQVSTSNFEGPSASRSREDLAYTQSNGVS